MATTPRTTLPTLLACLFVAGAVAGCSDEGAATADPAGVTAKDTVDDADNPVSDAATGAETAERSDIGGTTDAPRTSDAKDAKDAATKVVFAPGTAPKTRLWPISGELWIAQLGVDSFIPKMGEAAVVVGPDGTIVLVDVGNDKHAKQVRELIETLNTKWLTPARGYPVRTKRQVEWLLLTHWHADHVGGVQELLTDDPLTVTKGVIHRGWVDVGGGFKAKTWDPICKLLRGKLAKLDVPMCTPAKLPACDLDGASGHHPAVACDGLRNGDLLDATGDNSGTPGYLDLGAGARLTLLAADGWIGGGKQLDPAPAMGYDDTNQENARSLVGLVSHGDFRYHFGGDLTGKGTADEPDVETRLVKHVGPGHWHSHGVDVAHAHHHARKTSNNAALIDALSPKDGRSRNVVAGVSKLHVGSPQDEVVKRWTDGGRLGKGRFWTTFTTFTSAKPADFPALVDADGDVLLRTVQKGIGYWMQAPEQGLAIAYESVRHVVE